MRELHLLLALLTLLQGCSLLQPSSETPAPLASRAEVVRAFEQEIAQTLLVQLETASSATQRRYLLDQLQSLDPELLDSRQQQEVEQRLLTATERLAREHPALFLDYLTGYNPEEASVLLAQETARLAAKPGPGQALYRDRTNYLQASDAAQQALSLMSLAVSALYPVLERWFPLADLADLSISEADGAGLPVSYRASSVQVHLDLVVGLPAFELPHLVYTAGVPGQHLSGSPGSSYQAQVFSLGWGLYASGLLATEPGLLDPYTNMGYWNHRRLYLALAQADLDRLEGKATTPGWLATAPWPEGYLDAYRGWQRAYPGLALATLLTTLALEAATPQESTARQAFHQRILRRAPLKAVQLQQQATVSEAVDPAGS